MALWTRRALASPLHTGLAHFIQRTACRTTDCAAVNLPALPNKASLPSGGCEAVPSGTACTASCAAGYVGSPVVACKNGAWATSWSGSCSIDPTTGNDDWLGASSLWQWVLTASGCAKRSQPVLPCHVDRIKF